MPITRIVIRNVRRPWGRPWRLPDGGGCWGRPVVVSPCQTRAANWSGGSRQVSVDASVGDAGLEFHEPRVVAESLKKSCLSIAPAGRVRVQGWCQTLIHIFTSGGVTCSACGPREPVLHLFVTTDCRRTCIRRPHGVPDAHLEPCYFIPCKSSNPKSSKPC